MISFTTVEALKRGDAFISNSCRVLVVSGRIPFGCKKKIDIDGRILSPSKELVEEFKLELTRLRTVSTGMSVTVMEKAFNITHFDSRYRRQILGSSDSITLVRKIKAELLKEKVWPMGIVFIGRWPECWAIEKVLSDLVKSSIGDQ